MKIRSYKIKANHGTETPGRAVFVDTESMALPLARKAKGHKLVFRLGHAISVRMVKGVVVRRRALDFHDIGLFWDWIDSQCDKRAPLWVVAHKLTHDLTQLGFWDRLERGYYRLSDTDTTADPQGSPPTKASRKWRGMICVEDRPSMVIVRGPRGTIKFVDSKNYWNVPLKELGESVGLPKLECDPLEAPAGSLMAYCRRDTEIVERAMIDLWRRWREQDLGVFQLTAPKLALSSFRHKFMRYEITPSNTDEARRLERASYFGGRVQAMYLGTLAPEAGRQPWELSSLRLDDSGRPVGPYYHLDITSAYPAVMGYGRFPVSLIKHRQTGSVQDLRCALACHEAIAHVVVSTDRDVYPHRNGEATDYCRGTHATVLAGAELRGALERGDVIRVGEHAVYRCEPIFEAWVSYWWEYRRRCEEKGDGAGAAFGKLILNSMSGKWAQKSIRWRDRPDVPAPIPRGGWVYHDLTTGDKVKYRSICWNSQEQLPPGEASGAFPAITAFICSQARERMRAFMLVCPPRSILYTDTDSLIVTQPGYDAICARGLVRDRELGYLRVVQTAQEGVIRGLRDYRLDDREVMAGVPWTREEMADGSYRHERWEPITEVLTRPPDGSVIVTEAITTLTRTTVHGTVDAHGWVSAPELFGLAESPF